MTYLKLTPVTSTAEGSKDSNATGYVGILVYPASVSLEWSLSGAAPLQQLQMVAVATSAASTTSSKTSDLPAVEVTTLGEAESTASISLGQGPYSFAVTIVDPSSGVTLFTTVPTSVQISIAGETTSSSSSTAVTSTSLSYTLIPYPVYLGETPSTAYPFGQGGALIITSGDTLQLTTSFMGTAATEFYNVIQTAHQNYTVGEVLTTSTGSGIFHGNLTLAGGTYQVGVLIFAAGNTASPVAVSGPRNITVTLPGASTTATTAKSSSTTTGSTVTAASVSSTIHTSTTTETHASTTSYTTSSATSYSSASTSTGSKTYTSSSTSSTSSSSTFSTSSVASEAVDHLEFYRIPSVVAPSGYAFGSGGGEYAVTGGYIDFSLAFTGQNPGSSYSLILAVNGSTRTIGNYTTNPQGAAATSASAYLGTGLFALSLYVFDLSDFKTPTAVLITIPTEFDVEAHAVATNSTSSSSTSSSTSTHHESSSTISSPSSSTSTQGSAPGGSLTYRLQDVYIPNLPYEYKYATSGTVTISFQPAYSLLNIVVGFSGAKSSTTYNADLVLNGSNTNLGTLTTNAYGGAELHSSIQVNPGNYFLGVAIYDVSDIGAFNASAPVLVMLSDPETQFVSIAGNGTSSVSSTVDSSTQSIVTTTVTTSITTLNEGSKLEQQIQTAVASMTIPAVVQITPTTSTSTVYDSRFSLSIGQQLSNGVVLAISGENVTGPRVLLINMSRTSPLALYPALNITLDGFPVTEASSALQVLNPDPANPPYYVLVGTSTSIQILVSIPHFSVHLIQILGEIAHIVQGAVEVDGPLLAGSVLVVTIAFAIAYLTRKRYVPSPL